MNTIEKAISELLHKHDCVIVPGLGGFVSNYLPAYIDKNTNQLFAPSKSILFNKNLIQNDGLLANLVSTIDGCTYAKANEIIHSFVNNIKTILDDAHRFEISQLGVFFLNDEKNILFKPSKNNFLTQSFGLSDLIAHPIMIEEPIIPIVKDEKKVVPPVAITRTTDVKTRTIPVETEIKEEPIQEKRKRRRAAYFVLPILFVGVIGYSVFVTDRTDYFQKQPIQFSDFNPFNKFSSPTIDSYEPLPRDVKYSAFEQESIDSFIEEYQPVIEVEEEVFEDVIKTEEVKVTSASKDVTLKYHVVVGCFSQEENATNLVESYSSEGFSAHVIDKKGGLYRVSMQSYATRSEAKSEMKKIKSSKGISAWILKK